MNVQLPGNPSQPVSICAAAAVLQGLLAHNSIDVPLCILGIALHSCLSSESRSAALTQQKADWQLQAWHTTCCCSNSCLLVGTAPPPQWQPRWQLTGRYQEVGQVGNTSPLQLLRCKWSLCVSVSE